MEFGEQQLVAYGQGEDDATFDRRCPLCGRWTKVPKEITYSYKTVASACIANCKHCGKIQLDFVGFI